MNDSCNCVTYYALAIPDTLSTFQTFRICLFLDIPVAFLEPDLLVVTFNPLSFSATHFAFILLRGILTRLLSLHRSLSVANFFLR